MFARGIDEYHMVPELEIIFRQGAFGTSSDFTLLRGSFFCVVPRKPCLQTSAANVVEVRILSLRVFKVAIKAPFQMQQHEEPECKTDWAVASNSNDDGEEEEEIKSVDKEGMLKLPDPPRLEKLTTNLEEPRGIPPILEVPARALQQEPSSKQALPRLFEAENEKVTSAEAQRKAMAYSLQMNLKLLLHTSTCQSDNCQSLNCGKMKGLLRHNMTCQARRNQLPCSVCRRVVTLLHFHARECRSAPDECHVLHCKLFKEHIKQEMDATRRGQKRSAEEEGEGNEEDEEGKVGP